MDPDEAVQMRQLDKFQVALRMDFTNENSRILAAFKSNFPADLKEIIQELRKTQPNDFSQFPHPHYVSPSPSNNHAFLQLLHIRLEEVDAKKSFFINKVRS